MGPTKGSSSIEQLTKDTAYLDPFDPRIAAANIYVKEAHLDVLLIPVPRVVAAGRARAPFAARLEEVGGRGDLLVQGRARAIVAATPIDAAPRHDEIRSPRQKNNRIL